jgi:outer membrane lipoprotein carrier protein
VLKTAIRLTLLLALTAVYVGAQASAPTLAQTGTAPAATDARVVAGAVQAFYDQTRDVSASFYQTYVNKLYQRTDRSSGRVVFKKPGRMRWDYDKPNGKVIVSTGQKLLVYEPGEDGDKGQLLEQKIAQAQLPQALAFLMGTGRLEQDFTFRLLDARREGYASGDVLELRPRQPSPHYDRLLFYVERTPALRGLVRRLLIIDANGNRNRFDFSALKFNTSVADQLFDWRPPQGTRRVQM